MEKPAVKTYHHGNLRDALVAAGLEILESEGMAALSLRAVARHAGVSHAAPAHHFDSLGHLLAEIAAQGFQAFVSSLAKAANAGSQDPPSRLMSMARAYVSFAQERPALYTLMFRTTGPMAWTDNLQSAATAAWEQLALAVGNLLEKDAHDAASKSGAVRVWSYVHGYASLSIDNHFPPEVRGDQGRLVFEDAIAALPAWVRQNA